MKFAIKNRKTEQVNEFDDQAGVDGFMNAIPREEREDWEPHDPSAEADKDVM